MGGSPYETPRLFENRRSGRRRDPGRHARDRAVAARGEVAADLELPEVARHDLRHGAAVFQARQRRHRRQVPDPGLRARRDRAGPAGARRGHLRHGRMRAFADLFLHRQGPDAGARHRHPLRPERPPAAQLVVFRRGRADRQRRARPLRRLFDPLRQFRLPDGRLLPQRAQGRRGPEGAEVPHRRHGRGGAGQARRGADPDRARRRLPGAGARHDRRGRVRRPL